MMPRTLSAKLTLALIVILAVTGAAWIALTLASNRLYQEEVDQSLVLPDPTVAVPTQPGQAPAGDPALMLGDPSSVRLRDPDQTLKLDMDE